MRVSYHNRRTVCTLTGLCRLTVVIRCCQNQACERYHVAYHPEEEGIWALPQAEFGLEIIALVGALRYGEHRSIPEIHQQLRLRGVQISERNVTHLVERYEELVALRVADDCRLQEVLHKQGRVILAIDGLEPDAEHEVLWVLRDCLSGEPLLARALLSSSKTDLVALLREAKRTLPVAITAVVSDAEPAIRAAVREVLPDVPHQLCQVHYLRQASKPIVEADQHAFFIGQIADDCLDRLRQTAHDRRYRENLVAGGELRRLRQVDALDAILADEVRFADAPEIGDCGERFRGLTGDVEPQFDAAAIFRDVIFGQA